jgi:hypothetical protein
MHGIYQSYTFDKFDLLKFYLTPFNLQELERGLHPMTETFCTLQMLIKGIHVFESINPWCFIWKMYSRVWNLCLESRHMPDTCLASWYEPERHMPGICLAYAMSKFSGGSRWSPARARLCRVRWSLRIWSMLYYDIIDLLWYHEMDYDIIRYILGLW